MTQLILLWVPSVAFVSDQRPRAKLFQPRTQEVCEQMRSHSSSTSLYASSVNSCTGLTKNLYPEIDRYFDVALQLRKANVKTIELPEIFLTDSDYAPLVPYGASGCGKTQQAFSLLLEHKSIIFLTLNKHSANDQEI